MPAKGGKAGKGPNARMRGAQPAGGSKKKGAEPRGRRRTRTLNPADEEIRQAKATIETARSTSGDDSFVVYALTLTLGKLYKRHEKYDDALSTLHQALAGFEKLGMDASILDATESLAEVFAAQNKKDDALKSYEKIIQVKEKVIAGQDPKSQEVLSYMRTVHGTGKLHMQLGNTEKALAMFEKALVGFEQAGMEESSPEIIETSGDLAELYLKQKDNLKAMPYFERALKANPNRSHDTQTIKTFRTMAKALKESNRLQEALSYSIRAVEGFRNNFGDDHSSTVKAVYTSATIYDALKDYQSAQDMYLEAKEGFEKMTEREPKYNSKVVKITQHLAHVAAKSGDHGTALTRYETVLKQYAAFPESRAKALSIVSSMGQSFPKQKNYSPDRFLGILDSYHLTAEESVINAFRDIGKKFVTMKQLEDGIVWYEKALAGYISLKGASDALPLEVFNDILDIVKAQQASKLVTEKFKAAYSLFGPDSPIAIVDSLLELARSYRAPTLRDTSGLKRSKDPKDANQSRYQEALDLYKYALKSFKEHPKKSADDAVMVMDEMAQFMVSSNRFDDGFTQYGRVLSTHLETRKHDDPAVIETFNAFIKLFPQCSIKSYDANLQRLHNALNSFEDKLQLSTLETLKAVGELHLKGKHLAPRAFAWFDRVIGAFEKSPSKGSGEHLALLELIRKTAKSSKDDRASMQWLLRALSGYIALNSTDDKLSLEVIREMIPLITKNYDANVESFRRARKTFQDTYNHPPLPLIVELAEALSTSNQSKTSYEWFVVAIEAHDSSDTKGSKEHIAVIEGMQKAAKPLKDERTMLWQNRILTAYSSALPNDSKPALDIVREMTTIVTKNYEANIEEFRKALKTLKTAYNVEPLENVAELANSLASSGNLKPAWEWYQWLINLYENSDKKGGDAHAAVARSLATKAQALSRKNDVDMSLQWHLRAKSSFEMIDSAKTDLLKTTHAIATIYAGKDVAKSLENFEQFLEKWTGDVGVDLLSSALECLFTFAKMRFGRKQYPESLQLFNKVIGECEKHSNEKTNALKKRVFLQLKAFGAKLKGSAEHAEMAQEWLERALSGFDGDGDDDTLQTVYSIALLYNQRKDHDKAFEWFERALKGYEKSTAENAKLLTINILQQLAWIKRFKNDLARSLDFYMRALEISETSYGAGSPQYSTAFETVEKAAVNLKAKGDVATALGWYTRLLSATKDKHSKAASQRYADTLKEICTVAGTFRTKKEFGHALDWYQEALSSYNGPSSSTNPEALKIMNNIAITHKEAGAVDKAIEWHLKALKGYELCPQDSRAGMEATIRRLCIIYKEKDDFNKARELYNHALSLYHPSSSEYSKFLLEMQKVAKEFTDKADLSTALQWYSSCLLGHERLCTQGKVSKGFSDVVNNITVTAVEFRKKKDFEKALEWFDFGLAAYRKIVDNSHPNALNIVEHIAIIHKEQGSHQKALDTYDSALTGYSRKGGVVAMQNTRMNMVRIALEMNDYDKAMEIFEQGLSSQDSKGNAELLVSLRNIAGRIFNEKDYEKAAQWYKRAHTEFSKLGASKPDAINAATSVATCYRELKNHGEALDWYSKAAEAARGKKELFGILGEIVKVGNKFFEDKQLDNALEWFTKAQHEHATSKNNANTTERLILLGKMAGICIDKKDFVKALQYLQQSMVISFAPSYRKELSATLKTITTQAEAFKASKEITAATEWYEKAMSGYRKLGGLPAEMLDVSITLATMAREGGDLEKAHNLYRKLLTDCEAANKAPPQYIAALYAMSSIAEGFRKDKEYRQALDWYAKVFGSFLKQPDNLTRAIGTLLIMATIAKEMGDIAASLGHYTTALKLCEKSGKVAKEHTEILATLCSIAEDFNKEKDYKLALDWYSKALLSYPKLPDHQSASLDIVLKMATISKAMDEHDEALRHFNKALEICESGGRILKEHLQVVSMMCENAAAYSKAGDHPRAIKWYNRALVAYEKNPGHQSEVLSTLLSIADIVKEMKDYDKLLQNYNRALGICEKAFVPRPELPKILSAIATTASELRADGNTEKAIVWYRRALHGYEKTAGKESVDYKKMYNAIQEIAPDMPEEEVKGSPMKDDGMKAKSPERLTPVKRRDSIGGFFGGLQRRDSLSMGGSGGRRDSFTMPTRRESFSQPPPPWNLKVPETPKRGNSVPSKEHSSPKKDSPPKPKRRDSIVVPTDPIKTMELAANEHKKKKEYMEALKIYRDILDEREKKFGEKHAKTLTTKVIIAGILTKQDRIEEAMTAYSRALQMHASNVRSLLPIDKKSFAGRCLKRMTSLLSKSTPELYEALANELTQTIAVAKIQKSPLVIALVQKLGKKFLKHSEVERAHKWYTMGYTSSRGLRGKAAEKAQFECLLGLAKCAEAKGNLDKAIPLGVKAIKGLEKCCDKRDKNLARAAKWFRRARKAQRKAGNAVREASPGAEKSRSRSRHSRHSRQSGGGKSK